MTETEQPSASYSLSDFLTVVGRRKWVIIEVTALVASVAVLLSFQQAKVYQASAEVLLNRQDLGAALTGTPVDQALSGDPTRFGDTQAALARVPEVASRAIVRARVPGRTPSILLAESKVSPKANADLLVFTVDDADATAAAKLANAYATAFTVYRLELDTDTLHKARLELDSRIASLRNQGDTSSVLYRALIDKEQQLRTMELLQTRNTVVKQAVRGHQIRPTPKRNGLLGAAFGLFLGLAIAMVWDALDKRVRTEKEIEERLGLPLLARLPEPPRRLASDHRLAMLDDPGSIDSEAVRRLSTNIEFANIDRHAQVLLISSSVQREGKSTTISNLAVALARAGRNVVLVDLDLRQPAVAPFFRITQRIGVTDVVLGRAGLDQAIVTIPLPGDPGSGSASASGPAAPTDTPSPTEAPWWSADVGRGGATSRSTSVARSSGSVARNGSAGHRLSVLPAGALPPSPGEFLGTQALADVLDALRRKFELVLIDAPPIGIVGDGMTLSARVDGIIVVARLGVVDRSSLDDLARQLAVARAPALGFALTGTDGKDAYRYGSYFRHRESVQAEPAVTAEPSVPTRR